MKISLAMMANHFINIELYTGHCYLNTNMNIFWADCTKHNSTCLTSLLSIIYTDDFIDCMKMPNCNIRMLTNEDWYSTSFIHIIPKAVCWWFYSKKDIHRVNNNRQVSWIFYMKLRQVIIKFDEFADYVIISSTVKPWFYTQSLEVH